MRTRVKPLFSIVMLSAVTLLLAASLIHGTPTDKELGKKFVFEDVTFPDGSTGSIFASIRITRQERTATASYFDDDDGYLGQYRERNGFASQDDADVRKWAVSHYGDRE